MMRKIEIEHVHVNIYLRHYPFYRINFYDICFRRETESRSIFKAWDLYMR